MRGEGNKVGAWLSVLFC